MLYIKNKNMAAGIPEIFPTNTLQLLLKFPDGRAGQMRYIMFSVVSETSQSRPIHLN